MLSKCRNIYLRLFNDIVSRSKLISNVKTLQTSTVNVSNINLAPDYYETKDTTLKNDIPKNMLVFEDFLTPTEEEKLFKEIDPYMRRLRYEFDHWDNAIHGYRETERRSWSPENQKTLDKVKEVAFPPDVPKLAYVHILDLHKDGYIKPHVDAVRFCGNTIAGLCLLSSSVMRLVHDKEKDRFADILLKRRSLYIMRDSIRYDYTHEILKAEDSKFKGQIIPRDRRISVIMRNEPSPAG